LHIWKQGKKRKITFLRIGNQNQNDNRQNQSLI
jgi:hypothetical protein